MLLINKVVLMYFDLEKDEQLNCLPNFASN